VSESVLETGRRAFLGDLRLTIQLVEGIAEVEIAWHVARTRWREGIATEAATAVRDHAFGDLGLRRLIALVRPDNDASQGVARKLGMEVERNGGVPRPSPSGVPRRRRAARAGGTLR
jgi:RimJ/RimL family protein N-acetyltransferase